MLKRRKAIDVAGTRTRLDVLQEAVRREADGVAPDPLDDAMLAAVAGLVEATKAEAEALAEIQRRVGKLARRG